MSDHQKDKAGNKVKFIRKNGRVIPIKAKGSSPDNKSKRKSSPKKSKDSAARVSFDQASRIIKGGNKKSFVIGKTSTSSAKILKVKKFNKLGFAAGIGIIGASLFTGN